MEKVWVVCWYDDMCPRDEPINIGIGTTKDRADKLGKKYVNERGRGRYFLREVQTNKLRMF